MHDNLTSEIKLLTGKLNSMEEFRLQRDDLIAKFDTQEFELKEQAKKHKEILYEMERKVILDKERMRKDVENKLLELSTEFTKTSDLRVAASTQRLLRENIALNNDMDRILVLQARLQKENEDMKKKHKDIVAQYEASVAEKKRLIKTCDQQLEVIEKLTKENENSRDLNNYLLDIKRSHEVARRMTRDSRNEMHDLKDKIVELEHQIGRIENDRDNFKDKAMFNQKEFERVSEIIEFLRLTVKSAIKGEKEFKHDPTFHEARRNNLLTDLLNILNNTETRTDLRRTSSVLSFYAQGDLGFLPKLSISLVPEESQKLSVISSQFHSPRLSETEFVEHKTSDLLSVNIIDPLSGSLSMASDTNESAAPSEDDDTPFGRDDKGKRESNKTLSIDLRQSLEVQSNEEEEDEKEKEEVKSRIEDVETDDVPTDDNEIATDENDQ